jgi:Amt family ammonium transporter
VLGYCSGAVAGLVVITPAAGFVLPGGAIVIGILAGIVPFIFCTKVKHMFGYDDALDTFGIHAVGGTLGALLTGIFATVDANANLSMNLAEIVGSTLWIEQLKAMVVTIVLSVVATAVITMIVKMVVGLRPSDEDERMGLDLVEHGEAGYNY